VVDGTSQYRVGQTLYAHTKIRLYRGEKLIVKTERNGKEYQYTITGPYLEDKKEDKKEKGGLIKTLIDIVSPKKAGGAEEQIRERMLDPGLLIVSEDDNFCYTSGSSVKLWRYDSRQDVKVSITEDETLESVPKFWPATQDTLTLSIDNLDIPKGLIYLLKIGETHSTTLHQIPDEKTNSEKAVWAHQRGCTRQTKAWFKEKVNFVN
jgi:hypothetical protein